MRRNVLETEIQRQIEAALGSEPDLLLLRNSVGQARFVNDDGKEFFVPYGLGKGSPDLVGILSTNVMIGGARLGAWFCLEIKAPGEKPTPEQRKVHDIWRRFGAFVDVVTNVDEARAALERARRAAA